MASRKWNPPPAGTPCWINILSTDPQRAKKFYESVFDWKMRADDNGHVIHFETPGGGWTDGGITKVSEIEFLRSKGKGGVVLYLSVDDLKKTAEEIVAAGGQKVSEVIPEGDSASMQHFEDTEGNFFGIYEWRGNRE